MWSLTDLYWTTELCCSLGWSSTVLQEPGSPLKGPGVKLTSPTCLLQGILKALKRERNNKIRVLCSSGSSHGLRISHLAVLETNAPRTGLGRWGRTCGKHIYVVTGQFCNPCICCPQDGNHVHHSWSHCFDLCFNLLDHSQLVKLFIVETRCLGFLDHKMTAPSLFSDEYFNTPFSFLIFTIFFLVLIPANLL